MVNEKRQKRTIDLLFITACISTSLVLFLIGAITLLLLTANRVSTKLKERMSIEAILLDNVSDREVNTLKTDIMKRVYVKDCYHVSKDDALNEMSQAMGVNPTDFLEFNPFYASLIIQLDANYANNDSLEWIKQDLETKPQIVELNYQKELLNVINSNIKKITVALLALALLLSIISFTLINNTIKLTIYSQRFLLYSMKLVGAKWSFIRRPFIKRNLIVGIISAIIACTMLYGGLVLGAKYENGIYNILYFKELLPIFVVVFTFGLLITWICALSSVNRFLRMKSGELYYI
ncbi:MAG TPA: permease-like cell division protein FtsX [Bacteroidaceae bacterium]|nr:permease-like cell division protein FtsX [Bacteroidaceae bacterium]